MYSVSEEDKPCLVDAVDSLLSLVCILFSLFFFFFLVSFCLFVCFGGVGEGRRLGGGGGLFYLSFPFLLILFSLRPPRWPSDYGVRLESGRSRVRIPLAPGFFQGRVIPVT